ncbi:hypothetical protein C8R44DRAFT_975959 [Mycena epipterygia]|nr:hypothetical protein C8R44DRAFT_975959 [Mycena epipterygia]
MQGGVLFAVRRAWGAAPHLSVSWTPDDIGHAERSRESYNVCYIPSWARPARAASCTPDSLLALAPIARVVAPERRLIFPLAQAAVLGADSGFGPERGRRGKKLRMPLRMCAGARRLAHALILTGAYMQLDPIPFRRAALFLVSTASVRWETLELHSSLMFRAAARKGSATASPLPHPAHSARNYDIGEGVLAQFVHLGIIPSTRFISRTSPLPRGLPAVRRQRSGTISDVIAFQVKLVRRLECLATLHYVL